MNYFKDVYTEIIVKELYNAYPFEIYALFDRAI